VTTYHGIYAANGPVKRFYNSVMARGDVVIANSVFTRELILETYAIDASRVVVIPRGVDLDVFDPGRVPGSPAQGIREAWRAPAGRLVALVPARLSRWKGQDLLIEAAARVEAEAPGRFFYVLAGDAQGRDDYVAALDAAIARAGLGGVVRRVGHITDLASAFAAADFAIFPPTQHEAFGRGAVEAQAMGLAVIAADQGGFAETIAPEESGMLFTMGDRDALAHTILRMGALTDAARRAMGARGAARARALYSKQALQRATLEIYRSLLHNGAP
jgi:glycosyltransferase involved in cell wall biosynthesis